MRVQNIKSSTNIKPLKLSVQETPHITIEPNTTCNIQCRSCYKLNRNYVKDLNDVKKEIDLALKKRNLETITLLGGEPTLHPDIREIISYIKSKKLICQILTNGILFLHDANDRFLDEIIRSGIDRILLHIDIGQNHVHKNIEEVRQILFSKLEKKKVNFSLSITIYNEYQSMIPTLVKKYSKYKFFDGVLSVLARDPLPPKLQKAELFDEYKTISSELNIEPATYIPSNLNDNYVCWLLYFYYINANTAETLCLSPTLNGILRKYYRLIKGHHLFAFKVNPSLLSLFFFLTCLLEMTIHPKKTKALLKILHKSSLLRAVRFHYIAIQTPPEFNHQKNQYQICYHCPDATIRNGMLTSVCIADQISPLDVDVDNKNMEKDLYQVVYEHLEEI